MARSLVHDLIFRRLGSTDGHINSIAELALEMGKIVPPMCYSEGKLGRLDAVIGWPGPGALEGVPTGAIATYAYADSVSDLPLLEAVEAPFVVAPDRQLRAIAVERNWPVLEV